MPLDIPKPQTPDYHDAANLADALLRQADVLRGMSDACAKARTVIEFSGDRRKVALGAAFRRAKESGSTSATEAEHFARSSSEYETQIAILESQHLEAERVIQKHRAEESKYEAIRSALSLQKTIAGIV